MMEGRMTRPMTRAWRTLMCARLALSLMIVPVTATACATLDRSGGRDIAPIPTLADDTSHQKVGRPYQINGIWYVPARQDNYREVGEASWYGPKFHGRPTANGERFDMNLYSAAHPTLPIPSLVRVTNLENGRSMVVRLNDRGPFANDRIIDMSQAAARALGFEQQGIARVEVRYLGPARANDTAATPVGRYADAAPAARTPTPARSNADFYVQAGSFAARSNARDMRRRVEFAGEVKLETTRVDGRRRTRVLVGPWGSSAGAQHALRQLASQGFWDAHIVQR